ncbi:ABC transporter permease [Exiguobacterium sp. SH3S2]|uniref:ABC transporter permease n=1 Tax=unclassified Exiguobacterium TaxID=2644629 RepID=UPI00103D35D0|nr:MULTISPECIES: ABC transporter permease [unclassified Exiguobacterium]TCI42906.1 ABC transporter permease [Exiguobacterium sp. SH3S3]TCI56172.1 ABC transporter permease [Exiguobacterium sp. SH5S13]TCI58659.1 ABC transporter permease [Exiguobacterium sp. SH3S2]TCI61756.1 ABC transporter permease [Exiguobacterium sp. SH3S1]
MRNLAKRVIFQTLNDKRSVALILIAPLLILTLVYFLLGDSDYVPVVVLDEAAQQQLVDAFEAETLDVRLDTVEEPVAYLEDNKDVDAVFEAGQAGTMITLREPSTKSSKAVREIQAALSALNPAADIEMNYVYGEEGQSTFDSFGYVFLSLFSFFFVFILSAMALVKERSGGTLERLLMTPIKRGQVILGYTLGYGVFAVVQSVFIVLYTIYVLGLTSLGNIGWVFLVMILMAGTAVLFGATISVFARSELQVVQMIPFTIIPQVFFSGLIPLDLIPYGLGNLSYAMPIFYGATAIKEVMVYGSGFAGIWGYVLGLIVYAGVLYLLNMRALGKYRGH